MTYDIYYSANSYYSVLFREILHMFSTEIIFPSIFDLQLVESEVRNPNIWRSKWVSVCMNLIR